MMSRHWSLAFSVVVDLMKARALVLNFFGKRFIFKPDARAPLRAAVPHSHPGGTYTASPVETVAT